mmetsp:Transcript_9322/g.20457  ORF Transcript_9322/g.20457 Transcript_9322/m.20457 type:complete len:90 (-) Transcript_9322:419-688(-)
MLSPGGCFKTLGSDNRDREKVLLLLCKLGVLSRDTLQRVLLLAAGFTSQWPLGGNGNMGQDTNLSTWEELLACPGVGAILGVEVPKLGV